MEPWRQAYYNRIGKNLLRFRKEQGLSQQELSNKCNVDRAKISRIENGREDFMMSTLLELCSALNRPLEDLILEEPSN